MLDYANKKMNKLTKMKSNGGRRKKEGNEKCVMISFSFVQFTMFSPPFYCYHTYYYYC